MKQTETEIKTTIKCTNKICLETKVTKQNEYINRTNDFRYKNEVTLQQITDSHLYQDEIVKCSKCEDIAIETRSIEKAPEMFLIQAPRVNLDGTKIKTKVKFETKYVILDVNNQEMMYNLRGVIAHKGISRV